MLKNEKFHRKRLLFLELDIKKRSAISKLNTGPTKNLPIARKRLRIYITLYTIGASHLLLLIAIIGRICVATVFLMRNAVIILQNQLKKELRTQ